jgi:hypothetical protein
MPPQIKSHPWVYSAKIANGKITFSVEVTDFKSDAGDIEISGQATQEGGAFAPIYCIKNMKDAVEGTGDDKGRFFMEDVEANISPEYPFREGLNITVFVRVSKVWVTVIGEGGEEEEGGEEAVDPTQLSEVLDREHPPVEAGTWGKHKADAHLRSQNGGHQTAV